MTKKLLADITMRKIPGVTEIYGRWRHLCNTQVVEEDDEGDSSSHSPRNNGDYSDGQSSKNLRYQLFADIILNCVNSLFNLGCETITGMGQDFINCMVQWSL